MGSRVDLRRLTLAQLEQQVERWGLPRFRARQIFAWVHGRGVASTEPMTDLARAMRADLAARVDLTPLSVEQELCADDGTRKLRLGLADGRQVETVLIPDGDKLTQCLSSQVGCGLGCRFCATAGMGLLRNLTAGEIVDQVYRARVGARSPLARSAPHSGEAPPLRARPSNLVFMGMGEPLNNLDAVLDAIDILCTDIGANFSPRRITVSTAGVVPGINELGRRNSNVGLAVSLNATTDEVRDALMPVNRRWPLRVLLEALRRYPLPRRRRITFEYVLIAGLNDTAQDARRLVQLLNGIRAKVNLIPYNPVARPTARAHGCAPLRAPDCLPHSARGAGGPRSGAERSAQDEPARQLRRPDAAAVDAFAERLRERDLSTFVRQSRGDDIAAACGQLVAKAGDEG